MGKTNRPLRILLIGLGPNPIFGELAAKGHDVHMDDIDVVNGYDLILGPQCARFVPGMEGYLDAFVKGARAVKFGKKADA